MAKFKLIWCWNWTDEVMRKDFEMAVSDYLSQGWSLHGTITLCEGRSSLLQAMYKVEY